MQSYTMRTATVHDASELARLLTALGHPTTEESIRERWDGWSAAGNRALVAATEDGQLLGTVTLHTMMVLHRTYPVGRITALVVDEPLRGGGIGRALVAAAETLLAEQGCRLLEITSHNRLAEAHAFYEHLGYERTSIRLAKKLSSQP